MRVADAEKSSATKTTALNAKTVSCRAARVTGRKFEPYASAGQRFSGKQTCREEASKKREAEKTRFEK